MARRIYPYETAYLKNTGKEVVIIRIDDSIKPFRYYFKDEENIFCYAFRDDLSLRKPKTEK